MRYTLTRFGGTDNFPAIGQTLRDSPGRCLRGKFPLFHIGRTDTLA